MPIFIFLPIPFVRQTSRRAFASFTWQRKHPASHSNYCKVAGSNPEIKHSDWLNKVM